MKKLTKDVAELAKLLDELSYNGESMFVSLRDRLVIAYNVGLLRFEKEGKSIFKPLVRINRDLAVGPDNTDLYMVLGSNEKPYTLAQLLTVMEFDNGELVEIDAKTPTIA